MSRVVVHLFARCRDLAKADRVSLELPSGATVADLRQTLARERPALGKLLDRCAVAVNEEFAEDSLTLPHNAEVALLPPVSGGQ